MDENYIVLAFGIFVIVGGLSADSISFDRFSRPRQWHPAPRKLRIALITYGVLVIALAVSRLLGRG